MKRLDSRIEIGSFAFNFVNEVEIKSSWNLFTDTCSIRVPKRLEFDGKPIAVGSDSVFKRGDAVKVYLGYHPTLKLEFEGFVSDINPGLPLLINCQDAMWQLKQKSITKSFKSVNLNVLVPDVVDSVIPVVTDDVELGKFRINRANAVEVFEEIKKKYGLYTFIQNGSLYSGLPYRTELQDEVLVNLEKNVVDSSNLIYRKAEDVKIKAKAINIRPDNTKLEVEVGDSDGEQRTFFFYESSITEAGLKKIAEEELARLKIEGYSGDFTLFGEPFVQHNDVVAINSEKTPERAGKYLVKEVTKTFGMSGFRQVIELDRKVSN